MILLLSRPTTKTISTRRSVIYNSQSQRSYQTLSSILNQFELTYNLGPRLPVRQLHKLKMQFFKIVN
jgi:hypothetical protein